jgi:hypothetical protein
MGALACANINWLLLKTSLAESRMTPEAFVAALAASVRKSAEYEANYFAAPQSKHPPAHLARFSAWFLKLSPEDQEVAREVMRYTAEGSLVGLLTYIDNVASLPDDDGEFELWHVTPDRVRSRINDPEGALLYDLFNNLPEPGAANE